MSAAVLQSAPLRTTAGTPSARARIAGRVLSGLAIAFLAFDTAVKFAGAKQAVQSMSDLGYQQHHLPIIATLELICLIAYVIPRIAPLGAVLLTGYFGGAIATNLRLDLPLFSHTIFPLYVAALVWGGLYLRDARLRNLVRGNR